MQKLTIKMLEQYENRITEVLFSVKDMVTETNTTTLNRQFQDVRITMEVFMIELFDGMTFDDFVINSERFEQWLVWRIKMFEKSHFTGSDKYRASFEFMINKVFMETSYVHPQDKDRFLE